MATPREPTAWPSIPGALSGRRTMPESAPGEDPLRAIPKEFPTVSRTSVPSTLKASGAPIPPTAFPLATRVLGGASPLARRTSLGTTLVRPPARPGHPGGAAANAARGPSRRGRG